MQQTNPMHLDLPWGHSRKTKFEMCLKPFIDLVSKSFTAHYNMVCFRTWIKLFYACPKTPFPPQRDFSFPGTQSGSCKHPQPQSPKLGISQLKEHWGFTAECSAQGSSHPTPALPATANLLAEETSRNFENINNHLDSTQMLLCDIAALNNMS